MTNELFARLLHERKLTAQQIGGVVATGYARNSIGMADTTITEITCHAAGVHALAPEAATVVEMGGQDSKLLRLTPTGCVRDFMMNDRCAAGTGCFLEIVARRLETSLPALGALVGQSTKPALISSTCVVFAETEIIGLLVSGIAPADIAAGVQTAIAARIAAMTGGHLTPRWSSPAAWPSSPACAKHWPPHWATPSPPSPTPSSPAPSAPPSWPHEEPAPGWPLPSKILSLSRK